MMERRTDTKRNAQSEDRRLAVRVPSRLTTPEMEQVRNEIFDRFGGRFEVETYSNPDLDQFPDHEVVVWFCTDGRRGIGDMPSTAEVLHARTEIFQRLNLSVE